MKRLSAAAALLLLACSPAPTPAPPPSSAPSPVVSHAAVVSAPPDVPKNKPPIARVEHKTQELFGKTLVDDYAWLQKKGDPEVVAYLEDENAFTAAETAKNAAFEKTLYDEMLARIKEDDSTPPTKDGAWEYYRRYEKGKQYAIHCRKRAGAAAAPEVVLLDVNELGKNEKFIDVRSLHVSDDTNQLAYMVDTAGFRQFTLRVRDLKTGKEGSEAIPRVDAMAWAKDNKTLFYVTEDEQTKRSNKLFRHTVGESSAKDVLVYEEKDERFELDVDRTRSRDFVTATSFSHTTTEVRVIDASAPTKAPRVIAPREQNHEYYVDHRGDVFFIRTNSGGAKNFRLVTAMASDPRREAWKEVLAHRDDVALEDALAFRNHLVLLERKDAISQLSFFDPKTGKRTPIEQPEPVYEVVPSYNPEFTADTFHFVYQSLRTPMSYVDANAKTKARTVVKQIEVLGGFDANAYETARLLATARDGTKVPVSLVYKKGTKPDGTHPLFLHAYGSYGVTEPLAFDSSRVSLLDRGAVYAHAHIRGGGDNGKKWHDQGRMMSKMNTFTDFIDVAEHLKKEGWAKKDGLVIAGGSAGGLLMGAVTNLRPDLFTVVLAYVPFVDVMNTMLDEKLPLTVGEFEEWGNPKKKDEFLYMLQYSPYDNVAAKAYPTMLVRTSYNDSQVMYWEPAKWVARLRANKTDKNPLLLKCNMQPAGHGGKSGRFDRLHDTAFDYAFALTQLGVAK